MISGYVVGIFLVALTGGFAVWLFLTILGVPFALLLAFWAGLASLVPLVGATIGGIPYIAVAFFQGWPIGVAAIVFLIVYQQIENNVFQPVIHRYTVQLNPLWIILAVLIGATVLGILGALLAIPIAGIVQVLRAGVVERAPARTPLPPVAAEEPPPAVGRPRGVDPRSAELLELPAVRERLAGLTSFAGGRALALALAPSADPAEVAGARAPRPRRRSRLRDRGVGGPGGASDVREPARPAAARRGCSTPRRCSSVLTTVRRVARGARGRGEPARSAPRLVAVVGAPPTRRGAPRRGRARARARPARRACSTRPRPSSPRCAGASPPPAAPRPTCCASSPCACARTCRSRSPPSAAAGRCWR